VISRNHLIPFQRVLARNLLQGFYGDLDLCVHPLLLREKGVDDEGLSLLCEKKQKTKKL
jgi:hypothetical protein